MKLWKIVLFVLVPMSMFVWSPIDRFMEKYWRKVIHVLIGIAFVLLIIQTVLSVQMCTAQAKFDNAPEVIDGRRQIYLELPKELEEKYIKVGDDKGEWLTALDITTVNTRAVIRLVKVKNLKIKREGKLAFDLKVRAVATFCICMRHNNTKGYKLIFFDIRTDDGWDRVYNAQLKRDYRDNPKGWS